MIKHLLGFLLKEWKSSLVEKIIRALSFTVKGNPDDYYGEDCLSILINSGGWNDDDCDNKRGYICKRRGMFCCPFRMLRNNI